MIKLHNVLFSSATWLTLLIARYCYSYSLTDSTPMMKFMDNRMDGLNSSLVFVQHQIISIQATIKILTNSHHFDYSKLLAEIAELTEKVEENEEKITGLTAEVATLKEDVEGIDDRVKLLEESNKLWKTNFQVVNRTFTILHNTGCLKS